MTGLSALSLVIQVCSTSRDKSQLNLLTGVLIALQVLKFQDTATSIPVQLIASWMMFLGGKHVTNHVGVAPSGLVEALLPSQSLAELSVI